MDKDLAGLYGVETKYLNRQVKRNKGRFPREFMFQLTLKEKEELVTNWHRFRNLKYASVLPYAFTEHGVAMLSSVLNSDRAVKINIFIIKTFVRLREALLSYKKLLSRLSQLEGKTDKHDKDIQVLFEAIRQMIAVPQAPQRRIGFHP